MKVLRFLTAPQWLLASLVLLVAVTPAGAWPKILPHHFGRYPVPPRVYGWPLDDDSAGYYGGMRYREYYAYQRGHFLAWFPGSVPPYDGRWMRHRQWPYPEWVPPVSARQQSVPPNCACIIVNVPPDAEVWLEGQRTSQSGQTRTFFSPPLPPEQKFTYQVRARWADGAGRREQLHEVVVYAGHQVAVQFPLGQQAEAIPLPRLLTPPTTDWEH